MVITSALFLMSFASQDAHARAYHAWFGRAPGEDLNGG